MKQRHNLHHFLVLGLVSVFISERHPMRLIGALFFLLAPILAAAQSTHTDHPILAIGSPAPDFSLPGVDDKTHSLSDYATYPVLAVIFACNHCPISQMYEQRIQQLYDEYTSRGVAVVVIQPNDPNALRIDELDSSDISDSLDEMRVRAAWKHHLSLPLRRRYPIGRPSLRPASHTARLHLRFHTPSPLRRSL